MENIYLLETYIVDLLAIMLVIGVFIGGSLSFRKNKEDTYLFWLMIVITISCVIDAVVASVNGKSFALSRYILKIGFSWLFYSMFLIGPLWVLFIEKHINISNSKLLQNLINYICLIGLVGVFLNLFFPIIFYIDENTHYHRAQFFGLYFSFAVFFFLAGVYAYLQGSKKSGLVKLFPVSQFFIPLIVGIILEITFNGISIIWAGCAVSVTLMVVALQNENICIDKLTGLYNRYYLDKFDYAVGKEGTYCFMMVDLNGFKQINDSYGHSEGDKALISVADCLKDAVGQNGCVIRYAGDEFVILLNTKDIKYAEECVNDITGLVQELNKKNSAVYELSLSIGYEIFDMKNIKMDEIMEVIDKKMYNEKKMFYKTHDRRKIVDPKI